MTRSPSVPDSSSIEKTSENAESAGRHFRAGFPIRISKSQDVPTPSLRANGSAQNAGHEHSLSTSSLRTQGRQRAHPKHGSASSRHTALELLQEHSPSENTGRR